MKPQATTGSAAPGIGAFLASSLVVRAIFAISIVAAFALVARPSVPVAIALFCAAVLHIGVHHRDAPVAATFKSAFSASLPVLGLFLIAAIAAIPTAFSPANHMATIPKVFAFQILVILFFAVGRLVGPVNIRSVIWWMLAILAATVLVLVEEERWFLIRSNVLSGDPFSPQSYALLNRAFLLSALGLAFVLNAGRDLKSWPLTVGALVLMGIIVAPTESDSAVLVIAFAFLCLALNAAWLRGLLTLAVLGAIGAMILGPFVYDAIMQAWKSGPLHDFKTGTFLYRLETYADFSALIRDSGFLGRGLNSSKLLAADPSLFAMPNRPCAPGVAYCAWHPHNAGLEIVTDLGFLGIAWFGLLLWQIRTFILTLPFWYQRGIIAMLVAFLAISFVADGVWQTWWWFAAAIIALWIGILTSNPDDHVQGFESTER
ncbi:MAG: O-antigen ligase family protein [Hyphomicrobiaceae bacterium]